MRYFCGKGTNSIEKKDRDDIDKSKYKKENDIPFTELIRCDSIQPYSREEAFSPEGETDLPEGAENVTGWVSLDEKSICEMFGDLVDFKEAEGKVDWEKIDYEIYGEDWYREKFPHFDDAWYELLAKASREKFKDLTKQEEGGMVKEEGNFVISFGK